jgi:phage terminase small subunit
MIDAGLLPREEAFCRFFLKSATKSEAVILAGYSSKAPLRQLQRLLQKPGVIARINELKAKRAERLDLSADDVIHRINTLAVTAQRKGELMTALRCLEVLLKHLSDVSLRERKDTPAAPSVDHHAIRDEASDNVVGLRDAARRAKQARLAEDD